MNSESEKNTPADSLLVYISHIETLYGCKVVTHGQIKPMKNNRATIQATLMSPTNLLLGKFSMFYSSDNEWCIGSWGVIFDGKDI